MLTYLHNREIDYKQWDACVESSAQGLLYALSWYLDIVSPGWAAVVEEIDGCYTQVMPLPKASKMGLRYVRQPFFCQQLGLFSTNEMVDNAGLIQFIQVALRSASYVVHYSFNTHNSLPAKQLLPARIEWQRHLTHHIDLSIGYDEIYRQYSRDRKMNLNRARKVYQPIVRSTDIEKLIDLFKENTAHKIYGGVAFSSYATLRRLYAALAERGMATLVYATDAEGKPEAGCLFVEYKNKIIYLFNAASDQARKSNGRTLIIDEILRINAGRKCIFDFESPDVDNIADFYQSFGAEAKPFYSLTANNLPPLIRFIRNCRLTLYRKFIGSPS